jgi:hypothetical protein
LLLRFHFHFFLLLDLYFLNRTPNVVISSLVILETGRGIESLQGIKVALSPEVLLNQFVHLIGGDLLF